MGKSNKDMDWNVMPLENPTITELVLPDKHPRNLIDWSKYPIELTGLLYGVVRGNSLYSLGHSIYGKGSIDRCKFNQKYRLLNNELIRALMEKHPELISVPIHNHPRLPVERFNKAAIQELQHDLDAGHYDFLRDYGIEPSIGEVIAERSRYLSPEDIEASFGRMNILLSNTPHRGNRFSHVNAYRLDKDASDGMNLFRVAPLSIKPKGDRIWATKNQRSFDEIYRALQKEHDYKSDLAQ